MIVCPIINGGARAQPGKGEKMEYEGRVVFFGDSITKHLAPKMEKILKKEYPEKHITVINAGISGETSREALERLPAILDESPTVVVLGFGMNDWRKGITKKEFTSNLSYLIEAFLKHNARVIPLTINPDFQGIFKGTSREVDEYSDVIRDIARQMKIKIADVNALWKRRFKPIQMGLWDKIHPNPKGYEVYCESLMHVLPQSHTVVLWQYNGWECKCNYRCPYCYYRHMPKDADYFFGTIDQWHAAFLKAFGKQKLIFYLSFGEPMIGNNFFDVVKMVAEEPSWKLRVTTNLSENLDRLMKTRLVKDGRMFINASFHPTQTTHEEFLQQLLLLRKHGIEAPVVYVMWPPHLKRFEADFEIFDKHRFVVHVRRFQGLYKGKLYPGAYSDEERKFIARYCDAGTIKYMLNQKPVLNRLTYSGFHFFIVDSTGNIGFDSNCFQMHTKYRTIFGNILQSHKLLFPLEPQPYPLGHIEGTVDGVSNLVEAGYHQLEDNNVLSFARQGGVYHVENGVNYAYKNVDFNNGQTRAKFYFPPRSWKDELALVNYLGPVSYGKQATWRMAESFVASLRKNEFIANRLRPIKRKFFD